MSNSNSTTPGNHEKETLLELHIPLEQKMLIENAASLRGTTVSEFVLTNLYEAASCIIKEHPLIKLDPDEWKHFIETLDNSPELSPEVVERFRKAREKHKVQ